MASDEAKRYAQASAELLLAHYRKVRREQVETPLRAAREAAAHARESPPAVSIETLAEATERLIAAVEAALPTDSE